MGNSPPRAAPPAIQHLRLFNMPQLRCLHLPNSALKHGAIARLARLHLPRLQHLDLNGNALSHDGILQLAQSKLPQLTALEIGNSQHSCRQCSDYRHVANAGKLGCSQLWAQLVIHLQASGRTRAQACQLKSGPQPAVVTRSVNDNTLARLEEA